MKKRLEIWMRLSVIRVGKMINKNVGLLIAVIALVTTFIIVISGSFFTNLVAPCSPPCMLHGINMNVGMGFAIVGILLIVVFVIIFSKPKNRIGDYYSINADEELILKAIKKKKRGIFQSDLVKKTGMNKVKVSRILSRLEGKKVIERKKIGMTNIVLLR